MCCPIHRGEREGLLKAERTELMQKALGTQHSLSSTCLRLVCARTWGMHHLVAQAKLEHLLVWQYIYIFFSRSQD